MFILIFEIPSVWIFDYTLINESKQKGVPPHEPSPPPFLAHPFFPGVSTSGFFMFDFL